MVISDVHKELSSFTDEYKIFIAWINRWVHILIMYSIYK